MNRSTFYAMVGNVDGQLLDVTDEQVQVAISATKYYDPVQSFALGSASYVTLFDIIRNRFPAGLLPKIREAALEAGHGFAVLEQRPCPAGPESDVDVSWLHDFQAEALQACYRSTRGLVDAPAGAGKTEIMVALMHTIPCRWLVLVDSGDLARQGANRYHLRTGDTAGVVADQRVDIPAHARVIFATFHAVHAAHKYAEKLKVDLPSDRYRSTLYGPDKRLATACLTTWAEGLLCDEVQSAAAKTFTATIRRCIHAYWRFGFSATPLERSDNKGLVNVGLFGPIIYSVPPSLLIEKNLLAKPTIRLVKVEHPKDDMPGLRITDEYRAKIERNKVRNAAVVDMALRAAKPALLFVRHVKHLQDLTKRLEAKGLRVRCAWGAVRADERAAIVKALAAGEIDVVVANKVFYKGVDIPQLMAVIQGGAGKAVSDAIQQLGRGGRVCRLPDGTMKTSFEMWDFFDNDAGRMKKHAQGRIRAYKKAGYDASIIAPEDVPRVVGT